MEDITETAWWKRFHELYYDQKVTADDFLSKTEDLIHEERKASYTSGLEKAKEILKEVTGNMVSVRLSDATYELHGEAATKEMEERMIDAKNEALSEAQEKINEEINKLKT